METFVLSNFLLMKYFHLAILAGHVASVECVKLVRGISLFRPFSGELALTYGIEILGLVSW